MSVSSWPLARPTWHPCGKHRPYTSSTEDTLVLGPYHYCD
jgi:hypothetical protein